MSGPQGGVVVLVVALLLGLLHLTARAMCRRKGHRWNEEWTNNGTRWTAKRCRRCRVWADE